MAEAETMKGPYSTAPHSAKAGPALPAANSRDNTELLMQQLYSAKIHRLFGGQLTTLDPFYPGGGTDSPELKCT